MKLIYGKPIAEKILAHVALTTRENKVRPGLGVVLVGNDPASHLYVGLKEKAAEAAGIFFEKKLFPEGASESAIITAIQVLNERQDIHGLIVQMPLPDSMNADAIVSAIAREKDADGFHPKTIEHFLAGEQSQCPVFPRAVLELIRSTGIDLKGEKALVVANSELYGSVMTKALSFEGLDAEYILSQDFVSAKSRLAEARVIVTASGIPHLITGDTLKPGAIVIDGGVSRQYEKVVGDVDRASVATIAGFLSPVPGGVGPVTVAILLRRVTELAFEKR